MAGSSPAMTWWGAVRRRSAHRELQELDRVKVLHAAADALRRVEQDVGFCGERVADHAHAGAVDDQVAAAEIAEGDRERPAATSGISSASASGKPIRLERFPG